MKRDCHENDSLFLYTDLTEDTERGYFVRQIRVFRVRKN